jgi:hypothetical protein
VAPFRAEQRLSGVHKEVAGVSENPAQHPEALEPPQAPVFRPAVPVTFVQKKWVQNILPWITSAVLHLGILLGIYLVYRTAQTVVAVVREQLIVPDATLIEGAPVGGAPNPGLGADPNRPAAQLDVRDSQQSEVSTQGRLNQAVASGADAGTDATVLGIGAGTRGKGDGQGGGSGDSAGGLFGVPGGGAGSGPRVNFVGSSGNATRIVYLCDASGSMLSVFDPLRRQLRQSVDGLRLPQTFGVVMFNETATRFSPQLVLANPENKRRLSQFIGDQGAAGPTKPNEAIAQAFAMNPQLLFVLTDGFDQGDPKEILEQFRRLNREKKVRVNTILLRSTDDAELVQLLKTIATENGGTYREVAKDDF